MINKALKWEFEQWISTLEPSSLLEIHRKFLNLLIANFDTIVSLGTNGGTRAKKISELIEKNHETLSTVFPNLNSQHINSEKFSRIDELVIGPFRGFSTEASFAFDKKYIFMYGPNGSGKSSFCEGLEYALLDSIEEAESKRIRLDTYIRNTQKSYSVRPKVYGLNTEKQKVEIPPNSAIYRFSFVEKNRIDTFARISAVTASNQKNRIATLFGLDTFNDFVDKFTDNFNERYITLTNQKEIEFIAESQKIEPSKKLIVQIDEELRKHAESAAILINDVAKEEILSLDSLKNYLVGEDGVSGIIDTFQQKKTENIPDDIKTDCIDLILLALTMIREELGLLITDLEYLRDIASEVNYKNLYSAIELIA
ncbi:MAG: AAA family ATPase, partial [Methylobacter sp.]